MLPVMDGPRRFRHRGIFATLEETAQAGHYAEIASRAGVRLPPLTRVAKVAPLKAVVLNNHWKVLCPDCNGAELLWPGESLFMCMNCYNGVVGYLWRPVVVPKLPVRQAIERILMARPIPATRNWIQSESLASLREDNLLHGLPEEVMG